jgi:hypothetical protein
VEPARVEFGSPRFAPVQQARGSIARQPFVPAVATHMHTSIAKPGYGVHVIPSGHEVEPSQRSMQVPTVFGVSWTQLGVAVPVKPGGHAATPPTSLSQGMKQRHALHVVGSAQSSESVPS